MDRPLTLANSRNPIRRVLRVAALVSTLVLLAAGCASDGSVEVSIAATDLADARVDSTCFSDPGLESVAEPTGDYRGTELTLATHDSFVLSPGTLEAFTAETGISVTQIGAGDAGQILSTAILTRDNPTADVLFGVDNTLLCRALNADLFLPYAPAALDGVDPSLALDPQSRVTPIDFGDVCVNYWIDAVPRVPTTMADLATPEFAGQFVTQDPETSSPGLAFLLATIARFGEDGWQQYWSDLAANDLAVTAGWSDAYYGEFIAGGGTRSAVTSYASSPPAEVIFADPPIDSPPTGVIVDSCFRQVEFAGILAGSDHPEAAAKLIDFMLSPRYQEDIPLNMFVYPALTSAELPDAFVQHTTAVAAPLSIDPEVIEANRDEWTSRWREIALR